MKFSFPLQKEVEALDELCTLCKKAGFFRPRFCRKLERLRLHRIIAEEVMPSLRHASAIDLDWPFLRRLKTSGGGAAERWLVDLRRR